VVVIVLISGTLCKIIEKEEAFQSEFSGEGSQTRSLIDILCLVDTDGDNKRVGRFPFIAIIAGKSARILR
jgi:hypothetical protein